MAKDNVHELRPLCPVTLTLKDGSVLEWLSNEKAFGCPDGLVWIWAGDDDWGCAVDSVYGVCYGPGPQEAFDAMVERARKEMQK